VAKFDTVNQILIDVAAELGIADWSVDGASLTDPEALQLVALLKRVGRGLVLHNPWLQFRTDYTFDTTTATVYNLPSGFLSYVNGTGWNRSTRQRMEVLSAQQWEAMKASGVTVAAPVYFRVGFEEPATGLATLELLNTPTAGNHIYLEYWSRLWVRPTGATPTFLDAPAATTDTIRFDSYLITRALICAWKEAKGFDSTAAAEDLKEALQDAKAAAIQTAPTLSLNGARSTVDRLLSSDNVPETGFGT
jgi:hypothetical protein